MLLSNSKATPLTAMVGFTYDGIEKGLDPNGNEFDANTLKSPSIIESTLTDLGMDTKNTDAIRSAITISGVVPDDTIDDRLQEHLRIHQFRGCRTEADGCVLLSDTF